MGSQNKMVNAKWHVRILDGEEDVLQGGNILSPHDTGAVLQFTLSSTKDERFSGDSSQEK